MQLILAGIYHADAPTGNIPLSSVAALAKNRLVKRAMPLALGDSWRGYRIVGAGKEYLEHYGAGFASGQIFGEDMEAVLGAEVAARTRLGVGATFTGAHGISGEGAEHGNAPYRVVGVLAKTGSVLDRLVLTSIESVWEVHHEHGGKEKEQEVTVVLVQYASPLAAATLPRSVNSRSELQAASPAYETARLFRMIGIGVEALRGFAAVLILAAGLSVFIALYSALEERRYDLAIMRALGASPRRLFGLLMTEGAVLAFAGALLGLLLGHAFAALLGGWLEHQQYPGVTGLEWRREEFWVLAAAVAVSLAAALVPAWRAYRTDVSQTLAKG